MSFIATANPPVIGAEQPVQNHPWFPAVSLHDLRNVCLLDGTVTPNRLRHALHDDHLCTSEVAALCLELAGETRAAQTLEAYLDVFTHHYLQAKHQLPPHWQGEAHQRLAQALGRTAHA